MDEIRDEAGRLVYAPTSNHGRHLRTVFPGPQRALPRTNKDMGVTPPKSLMGDWVPIEQQVA